MSSEKNGGSSAESLLIAEGGESVAAGGFFCQPVVRIELKAAPAELSDGSPGDPIEEIHQRKLFRMAREIVGEDFDEFFLTLVIRFVETFSHVQFVGPPAAIKPQPKTRDRKST